MDGRGAWVEFGVGRWYLEDLVNKSENRVREAQNKEGASRLVGPTGDVHGPGCIGVDDHKTVRSVCPETSVEGNREGC